MTIKRPVTKAMFLTLFLLVFGVSAAHADTLGTLRLRITGTGIASPIIITDGGAGDTNAAAGQISWLGGFFGSFFIGATQASAQIVGGALIQNVSSQVGNFSGGAAQITMTVETIDSSLSYSAATYTATGGTGILEGVSIGNSADVGLVNPFDLGTAAQLIFPAAGGNQSLSARGTLGQRYVPDPAPIPSLPEPLSILLLGSGLAGIGLLRRMKS